MPLEGGVHGNPHDKCAQMCRRYVGNEDISFAGVSYMETFCEKKIREKLTGKNYRGVAILVFPPPLSRIRVKCFSMFYLKNRLNQDFGFKYTPD